MKFKFVPLALALAALVSLGTPATLRAQDDEAGMAEKKPALKGEKKDKPLPFSGAISAMDKDAKTITLKGKEKERVITLSDETKITKDGAAATWDDLKAGEMVRGQIMKSEDGKEVAKSVMIGEKAKGEKKEKKEKKAKTEPKEEMTQEKAE